MKSLLIAVLLRASLASHSIGVFNNPPQPLQLGPGIGEQDPTDRNAWISRIGKDRYTTTGTLDCAGQQAETKFVLLHFIDVDLPGGNKIVVDLGYNNEVDTFSGQDNVFWTRPINTKALGGKDIVIKYVTDGTVPAKGKAAVDLIGLGQRQPGVQKGGWTDSGEWRENHACSNCDPFWASGTHGDKFDLGVMDDRLFWCDPDRDHSKMQAAACAEEQLGSNDVRARVARSVGMIIVPSVDGESYYGPGANGRTVVGWSAPVIGTCSLTLVAADQVLLAGHCIDNPDAALAASVTFDYQTTCDGGVSKSNPNPRFYKVAEVVGWKWYGDMGTGVGDFVRLRLKTPVEGITPIEIRRDLPSLDEDVFVVHHPYGAPKMLSPPHQDGYLRPSDAKFGKDEAGGYSYSAYITVPLKKAHLAPGSSGSGLFDTRGRLLGVASTAGSCGTANNNDLVSVLYFATAAIVNREAAVHDNSGPARDVVLVMDRSGSMNGLDRPGGPRKIDVARDAAEMFVQLLRPDMGNRVGLVSFSSTATLHFPLTSVDQLAKIRLIERLADIRAGGTTSIGSGLKTARDMLTSGSNPRAVFFLTDGIQNTDPSPAQVLPDGQAAPFSIWGLGYGSEGSIQTDQMNALTAAHGGQFQRTDKGIDLVKFFFQTFGDIFETGTITDPSYLLPAGVYSHENTVSFRVCRESSLTVAVGWDNMTSPLRMNLTTPHGTVIPFTSRSSNVTSREGRAWAFMRVSLPYTPPFNVTIRRRAAAEDPRGTWNVTVYRNHTHPSPDTHYFVSVITTAGPMLRRVVDPQRYYTSDTFNPRVHFRFAGGGEPPPNSTVVLEMRRPNASIGRVLSGAGLHKPGVVDGDAVPARQQTWTDLVSGGGQSDLGTVTEVVELTAHMSGNGGYMEPNGIFGRVMKDKLVVEGDYVFTVRATTGKDGGEAGCAFVREMTFGMRVDVGIDGAHTDVATVCEQERDAEGRVVCAVTVTPKDRYGNMLGPGMGDVVEWLGTKDGSTAIVGGADGVKDNGDGSYTIKVRWNPGSGKAPAVLAKQPGRMGDPVELLNASIPPGFSCARCSPFGTAGSKDACDVTAACSSTPYGTMCACRPGYKAAAANNDTARHWRLQWPVPGHEHRVYVKPGMVCDVLCDQWYMDGQACQEVALGYC